MFRTLFAFWVVVSWSGIAAAQESATPAPTAQASDQYVWADACRGCHAAQYDAWAKTKHARAIERLSREQRVADSACVSCHISGLKEPVDVGGQMVNANVQCEACHGPGRAHAEAAQTGAAPTVRMVASPPERTCTLCHREASPHYRGFFYAALKGLVHR